MEYKSIDYETFKDTEHEIDGDYAAHLGLTRGGYDDGIFKFTDTLVCNGGMATGYYQVRLHYEGWGLLKKQIPIWKSLLVTVDDRGK